MNKEQCPICGEYSQEHKIKIMKYTYKKIDFLINQPAKWCDACGEGIIDSHDSKAVVHLIQAEKARIDGLLTPDEIKNVRKQLKLTQKQASVLLGGSINAFNRYEHGKIPVPRSLSLLLTMLHNHSKQLKEIIKVSR